MTLPEPAKNSPGIRQASRTSAPGAEAVRFDAQTISDFLGGNFTRERVSDALRVLDAHAGTPLGDVIAAGRRGTNQHTRVGGVDNIKSCPPSGQGGTSPRYAMARLLRDRPDLAARVKAGELSAHAAAVEAQADAAEIKLRAERRIGELLEEQKAAGERRKPTERARGNSALPLAPTLEDLGVGKMQASRWQAVAKVPEAEFEAHVATS